MLFARTGEPAHRRAWAALLYASVGLPAWPVQRTGGLLGARGARAVWAVLWLVMAVLWLLDANSGANATSSAIDVAPSGMGWLSTLQTVPRPPGGATAWWLPARAVLSAAIGMGGAANWRPKAFLGAAVLLTIAYWVNGQGLGDS